MVTFRNIFTSLLLASATLPLAAQTNGSNSPYSRYGFGLLGDRGNAFNKGMAGTAYGMQNGKELNTKNPASYAAIDSLTFLFDLGLSMQNGNIAQGGVKTNAKNSSVDYVTAGFRVAKNVGMSLGLVPFSTIGYNTSSKEEIQASNQVLTKTTTFSGDGGLHEAYIGVGWAPFRRFSIGMNAGYLWGGLSHTVLMNFDDSNINSTRQAYETDIRTYKADFGLQYVQPLDKKNTLTLGLTYGLGHDIKRDAYYYNQKVVTGSSASGDTLVCRNAFQLPHTLGAGITWTHDNSLRVGVDYTFQKWADMKFPMVVENAAGALDYVGRKDLFTDLHKVSLGMEYVKNPEGLRWRQRVRYRAGFSYQTPYTKIGGVDGPQHFLASVGVALPITNMHNSRSLINFSAQYERVKPKMAGMITENYIRFSIGLTFNERWFMKWKAE